MRFSRGFRIAQMRRGCNPARSLAQSVVDAQARAAAARHGKPFQLAVADLAAVTGLDFGPIAAFDATGGCNRPPRVRAGVARPRGASTASATSCSSALRPCAGPARFHPGR